MDLFRALGMGGGGPLRQGGFGAGGFGAGGAMGFGGGAPDPSQPFRATYRCYPVVMAAGKESLEGGDKILLPTSALDQLARLRVTYPMMFRLSNPRAPKAAGAAPPHTHCGVMEFSADEGTCYMPYWMMQNLLIESGGLVDILNVSLRKGSYVKFQPHSTRFMQLHNPRVVLERALRNFSCLTQGDTIAIQHGAENFYLDVKELRPERAVSIIETDVNVDFDAPKDMPAQSAQASAPSASSASAAPAASPAAASAGDAFSFKGGSSAIATTNASAAQRDFTTGGWGAGGTGDDDKDAAAASALAPPSSASNGSDYFARLGGGNKLTGKRGRGNSSAAAGSAGSSAQASPMLGAMGAAAPPAASLGAAASSSASAAKPALARPQSALASRPGGYSLSGSSSSSSSAAATRPSTAAPARPASSSGTAPALGSSASSSSLGLGLGPAAGTTRVIERQGNWNYHYEIDAKGTKRLIRRLPASDKPAAAATAAATPAAASSSSSSSAGSALAGKGYSLK